MWDLIYPVKQVVRIVNGNGGRLRNLIVLLVFPISWPTSIFMSLFKLFGRHSYALLGLFSLFLIFLAFQTEGTALLSFGLTGIALSIALLIRFLSTLLLSDQENISQIAGTFEGGLVLVVANLPLDYAIFDFASEWSQPGPWFWSLGGGINTAAAVWLVMSNNRLLIYLLNIILEIFGA